MNCNTDHFYAVHRIFSAGEYAGPRGSTRVSATGGQGLCLKGADALAWKVPREWSSSAQRGKGLVSEPKVSQAGVEMPHGQ